MKCCRESIQQTSQAIAEVKGSVDIERNHSGGLQREQEIPSRLECNCFTCGKKGPRAEGCLSAIKEFEKLGDAAADKMSGSRGKGYVCGSEEHFAHKHFGLCRSLRHRTRDCEEQRADKGAILVKMNLSANSEVG